MKLGIICNRVSWEEKKLFKEAQGKNLNVHFIFVDDLQLEIPGSLSYKADETIYLQRAISFFDGFYITAALEGRGERVINSLETAKICGDKILTTINLAGKNIKTPLTFIAFNVNSALKSMEKTGFPCIIKPPIGSWGRLVALIKDYESAKVTLEDRETLGNPYQKVFYVQEYIPAGRDIRVFVVGEEVVAAMYRYNAEKDWRSNLAIGGKAVSCKVTSEIEDISLKVTESVKGEIIGVDLIEKDGSMYVQELNHVPQFRGVTEVSGVNVASKIINYILNEVKN